MILANLIESMSREFDRKMLWGTCTTDDASVIQEENCGDA